MEDYSSPWNAQGYLDFAAFKDPHSLAVALVHGLVRAQMAQMPLLVDWCQVWISAEAPLTSPKGYIPDIRAKGADVAAAYLFDDRQHCQ
jgi:hypothetical protein